jgi:hypothetical protein
MLDERLTPVVLLNAWPSAPDTFLMQRVSFPQPDQARPSKANSKANSKAGNNPSQRGASSCPQRCYTQIIARSGRSQTTA